MKAMRHWVMGAGLFLFLGAFVHETVAQDRLPIIDMHMHPGDFTLTVAAMERYNIVLGFLSGNSLDDVFEWVEALPGRFIASPIVRDPADLDLARLRREYEADRLIVDITYVDPIILAAPLISKNRYLRSDFGITVYGCTPENAGYDGR